MSVSVHSDAGIAREAEPRRAESMGLRHQTQRSLEFPEETTTLAMEPRTPCPERSIWWGTEYSQSHQRLARCLGTK